MEYKLLSPDPRPGTGLASQHSHIQGCKHTSVPCLDPRPRQARQSQMRNVLSARLSLDPLPWRARDHGTVPSPFWSTPPTPYQTQEKTQGKL